MRTYGGRRVGLRNSRSVQLGRGGQYEYSLVGRIRMHLRRALDDTVGRFLSDPAEPSSFLSSIISWPFRLEEGVVDEAWLLATADWPHSDGHRVPWQRRFVVEEVR